MLVLIYKNNLDHLLIFSNTSCLLMLLIEKEKQGLDV